LSLEKDATSRRGLRSAQTRQVGGYTGSVADRSATSRGRLTPGQPLAQITRPDAPRAGAKALRRLQDQAGDQPGTQRRDQARQRAGNRHQTPVVVQALLHRLDVLQQLQPVTTGRIGCSCRPQSAPG
jgi:hypothetical protein